MNPKLFFLENVFILSIQLPQLHFFFLKKPCSDVKILRYRCLIHRSIWKRYERV